MVSNLFYSSYVRMQLWSNGVKFGKNLMVGGIPYVHLSRGGKVIIGDNCAIRSWARFSDTGENRPTVICTMGKGVISIGNNTGMTSTLLHSENSITIGNNVKIGGGTRIFDTNFHSIDAKYRNSSEDRKHVKTAPVVIEDNVFIGTGCIITKGVTIGANSIIAAGSVVINNVNKSEIWGGNPAKLIKKIQS